MSKEEMQSITLSFSQEIGIGIFHNSITFSCKDLNSFKEFYERICLLKVKMEQHIHNQENELVKNILKQGTVTHKIYNMNGNVINEQSKEYR